MKIVNRVGIKKCRGCDFRRGGLHIKCANPNKCSGVVKAVTNPKLTEKIPCDTKCKQGSLHI